MINFNKEALNKHFLLKGKIKTEPKVKLKTKNDLSTYYSPGVGAVSKLLVKNPEKSKDYLWTNNLVAVISDGSAVLGLGNIGPIAAMPVMEGKCLLFKHFAGVDAIPIVLDCHNPDQIVETIVNIAPSFGAINLEDIAAPQCFYIESMLKKKLNIPVMHDDQHGTAIVVLAGLINSFKVIGKNIKNCKITIVGAGAAGDAITRLIHQFSPSTELILVDSKGIISADRSDLNHDKQELLKITNPNNLSGDLKQAIHDSQVFIGVSKANLLNQADIKSMKDQPIIFALANPDPEIEPKLAKKAGAAIVATGRSDYPNQINNVLAFPGIFRGALDHHVNKITETHKIAAAQAIASQVRNPSADQIIPSVFDKELVSVIAALIK
jgi:malate dehydrogenase (oxaloacetate-decarboxylating)